MRKITDIIIHCADTPNGKEFHASDIDQWHKQRGWSGIGYHWVICVDGKVEAGRIPDQPGAHCEGHNANSLGICMIGKDKFTREQWESLQDLVKGLYAEFKPVRIAGHCEYDTAIKQGKTCPNFDVSSWWADGCVPDDKHIL